MKNKLKGLFAIAIAVVSTVALQATTYIPGLAQAQFSGSSNVNLNNDILSADNLTYVAGPIMANTSNTAYDWLGKGWSWGNNRDFGYVGQMYMEKDVTYTFAKSIDDWTYIKIEDTVIIQNTAYQNLTMGSYTPTETGWYDIEIRMGNGGGSAGLANGAKVGIAYNTVGNTSGDDFKTLSNGWTALLDSGDASLLRFPYTEDSYIVKPNISVDGDDLDFSITLTNIPAEGGSVSVVYGSVNGNDQIQRWENVVTYEVTENGTISGTIEGAAASAAFVAMRAMGNQNTTTNPWVQWTTPASLKSEDPCFELVSSVVSYGYLSYNVNVLGIGADAESVSVKFELSTTEDFSEIFFEKDLAVSGFGSEPVVVENLTPSTVYYARAVGSNNLGVESVSNVVGPITTLTITPVELGAEIQELGWDTISVYCPITTFGDGSEDVTLYIEASTDASFSEGATLVSEPFVVTGDAPTSSIVSISGLSGATPYFLRVRAINSWELVTLSEVIETSTISFPFESTDLNAVYSGSSVTVSSTMISIVDGCTVSAVIYDGATVVATFDSLTMDAPEISATISLNNGNTHNLKLEITGVIGGSSFTKVLTQAVANGNSSSYDFADPSAVYKKVFQLGDTASFLPILGGTYLVNGDGVAQIGADGMSFTTVNPGISFLEVRDPYNGVTNRYDFFVAPKVLDTADIFMLEVNGTVQWQNAAWTKLTSNTERTYPNASDDIAIIYYNGAWARVEIPAEGITVGSIIIRNGGNWNAIAGVDNANAVLTLDRTDGERPFVLIDNPQGGGQYAFGSGNGAKAAKQLKVKNDDEGWDFVFGAPHTLDSPYFNNINNTIHVYVEGLYLYIPKGQTFRIIDRSQFRYGGDPSRYSFRFEHGSTVSRTYERFETCGFGVEGEGTIEIIAPGDAFTYSLRYTDFAGTVKYNGWNRYLATSYFVDPNAVIPFSPNVAYEVNGGVSKADDLCDADLSTSSINRSSFVLLNANITTSLPQYENPPENFLACKYFRLNGGWLRLPKQDTNLGVREPYVMRLDDFRLRGQGYIAKPANFDATRNYFSDLEITKFTRETPYDSFMVNGANVNNRIDFSRYGVYIIPDLENYLVGTPDEESEDTGVYQIIPWMVLGENDNGGNGNDIHGLDVWVWQLRFATVTNGVVARCTNNATDIYNAVEDANVVRAGVSFSLSKDVTINSLILEATGDCKLNGYTLTIKSGALAFTRADNDVRVDVRDASKTAGTIVLGDESLPGYIHATCFKSPSQGQHSLWASIIAPGGLVKCLPGRLFIFGDQTGVEDTLVVNGGNLWLGYPSWGVWANASAYDWQTIGNKMDSYPIGCTMTSVSDFIVRAGAVLGLARDGTKLWTDEGTQSEEIYPLISGSAAITLEDAGDAPARVALGTTYDATAPGTFTCGKLYINDESMPRGTWGSSESSAEFVDDFHFYGPGVLEVKRDDLRSATMILVK